MPSSLRAGLLALLVGLLVGGAGGPLATAQDGDQPIVASDLFRIQDVGSVTASPDGRNVAYTVRSIEETDDGYTYRTHLYLIRAARGEAPQQLTHGARGGTQPAWHPAGDQLAFVRSVDGTPQIFILPVFGGEAYQLTDFAHGASTPRWSPNGQQLLFASSLPEEAVRELTTTGEQPAWPHERPRRGRADVPEVAANMDGSREEVRALLERNATDDTPRLLHRLDFQGERDLQPRLTFRHFFVLDVGTPDAEPTPATHGFYSFGSADWLPNGQQLVVSAALDAETHPDRVEQNHLYLVTLDQPEPRLLLAIEDHSLRNPQVAPDGRTVLFQAADLNNRGFAQTQLGLFNLSGRAAPNLLTAQFDRSASGPRWSRDNWGVYFTSAANGGFPLYRLSLIAPDDGEEGRTGIATGLGPAATLSGASRATFAADEVATPEPTIERLTAFTRGVRSFDVTDATVYFAATEVANPYELFSANLRLSQEEQLTRHNADWLADKRLSFPTVHTVQRDTFDVQYWVMPPAGFDPETDNGSFPVMLEIHGGPSAMWGPGEVSMWHEFQLMAARGFGIVYSNPRGSGGYGNAFRRANYQNWGDGPAADVLAALDDALDRYPWLDANQQVVTGGSYAGYLTAWIVSQTDRFEAALAQRGVYELQTFLGEGNAWRLVPTHFGGYPWEEERPEPPAAVDEAAGAEAAGAEAAGAEAADQAGGEESDAPASTRADTLSIREILAYNSPLTHVANIRTPLLIMHADNDLRTGVIQSEMLYKSLKILERPVEYIRYPDAGHDLSRTGDPTLRIDRLLRIYEFMSRYVDLTSAPLFIETFEPEPVDLDMLFDLPQIPVPETRPDTGNSDDGAMARLPVQGTSAVSPAAVPHP